MITGAVICEFNPFHNGHKFLIDEMKNDGCDCVIAVMSTSFTQRGDVAIYSKFQRTKDAIMGGADIVIELPVIWAVSSAQRFARAGCEIIKALGFVDRVYFGSECGDIEILKACASATEDEKVENLINTYMKNGDYFPTALQKAVRKTYSESIAEVLSSPNNTLALEYIKSLRNSNIEVRTINRTGVHHDSLESDGIYASASKIRADLCESSDVSAFIPQSNCTSENFASFDNAERGVIMKLRSMSLSDFEILPDVSEGLHNRIKDAVEKNSSICTILETIKTKRYTHARLRRILTCALLGITKELQEMSVPYIRILGYKSQSECVLKTIFEKSTLPVIMSVAKDKEKLGNEALRVLNLEISATDMRTAFEKSPTPCSQDFTEPIIKI